MELSAFNSSAGAPADPLFDWAPDAERLDREVRSAELNGRRDELTLAEIECSMDLLDAEIAALRQRPQADLSVDPELKERTAIRRRLAELAFRLERLPG